MKLFNNKREAWLWLRALTADRTEVQLNPMGYLSLRQVIDSYNTEWGRQYNIEGGQPITMGMMPSEFLESPVQTYAIVIDRAHSWIDFEPLDTSSKASPFRDAMAKCIELGEAVKVLCDTASVTYARILASNHFKGQITVSVCEGGLTVAPRSLAGKTDTVAATVRKYAEEAFMVPNTVINLPIKPNQVTYARNIAQALRKGGLRLSVTSSEGAIQISAKSPRSPLGDAIGALAVSVKIGLFSWDQVLQEISRQMKPMEVVQSPQGQPGDIFRVEIEEDPENDGNALGLIDAVANVRIRNHNEAVQRNIDNELI